MALNCSNVRDGISMGRIHTVLKSLFLGLPPLCKQISHARIDQYEDEANSGRNICAKILNSTAPSSSRGTEESCRRSNLITFFGTSKQLLSNGPVSTSLQSRWLYGNVTVEEEGVDVCFGLALATGSPALSPMYSMCSFWVSSVISVTSLLIPFTIITQEQVPSFQ